MDNIKIETKLESLKSKSKPIQVGLKPILWSKNIKNLDSENDKIYIIHQVLSYGSIEDIKLLLKIYSKNEIRNVFVNFPKKIYTRPVFIFLKDFLLKINLQLDENNYVKNFVKSTNHNQTKISFIFFPFKRKYKPVNAENSISLTSYKDIASDKAYAIGRRPEYRDYMDLFVILKNGFSLKRVIVDAKEKFAGEFSEKLFLSQLIYFEDLKDFTVELIKEKYSVDEIKSFFKQAVLNYL